MRRNRQWYVAVKMGRDVRCRAIWRLYAVSGQGVLSDATPLGDYDRLTKIRGVLAYGDRTVEVLRNGLKGRQVAFRIGPKGSAKSHSNPKGSR